VTGAVTSATGVDGVLAALKDGDPSLVTAVVLLDPIAAPADSAAILPATADIALYVAPAEGLPAMSGEPAFEVTVIAVGSVVFDLSDGYSLSIDEAQSAVFVANALTGESILVWGAAQIALDGADAARFWGTTSVVLGNGTKITMETAVDAMIADLFRLDRLTVTQADRAMVITGISEETLGDLAVAQSMDGATIDAATRDGLTLVTDLTGSWSDEFGNGVTQAILDQTAPGELYGPGETTMSLREFAGAMWNFVTYDQIDSLMLTIGRNMISDDSDRKSSPSADVYRALALYAGESARFAAGA
jgi:hypothetical protein